jgi:hypothetical protein
MTKVQLSFPLAAELSEEHLRGIGDLYSTYGILKIGVQPGGQELTVEYDATRFGPADVESALARAGLPLVPRSL